MSILRGFEPCRLHIMKIGHSLWLTPEDKSQTVLSELISKLAKKHQSPIFPPHVTLIGLSFLGQLGQKKSIDAATKLSKLSPPLKLDLGNIDYSTTYFQCLFARINATPQLMNLYLESEKHYEREPKMYMPHLSLLYGDIDMESRHRLAQSTSLPISTVTFDTLTVVKFDLDNMDPTTWKIVDQKQLQNNN